MLEFDAGEAGEPARRVELMRLHRDTVNPSSGDVAETLADYPASNRVQNWSGSYWACFLRHGLVAFGAGGYLRERNHAS